MRRWEAGFAAVIVVAPAVGCLRATSFQCETDAECTSRGGGTCEAVHFCSFADPACPTGQRYGDYSGPYANRCVGDEPEIDAGVDGAGSADAPAPSIDALVGCPASYTAITGTHLYGKIPSAEWSVQRTACAAANGYLVIPDDAAELTAVMTLAGADTWIGITDAAAEGQYVTVLGAAATFLPWQAGQPDNGPGNADCVTARTTGMYLDDKCNLSRIAVCECVPP